MKSSGSKYRYLGEFASKLNQLNQSEPVIRLTSLLIKIEPFAKNNNELNFMM